MAGERDGIIGMDEEPVEDDGALTRGGFSQPGPIGLKGGGVRIIDRKIANVTKDWVPNAPSPVFTEQEISASTIAEVGRLLNTLEEWGKGGGKITNDPVPGGTSPTVDVSLHVKLELMLPKWMDYGSASAKAKAEWDRMYAALKAHEDVHLQNVIDVANDLAAALPGKSIDDLVSMVNATDGKIKAKQRAWDNQTNHGKNTGVTLDPNII